MIGMDLKRIEPHNIVQDIIKDIQILKIYSKRFLEANSIMGTFISKCNLIKLFKMGLLSLFLGFPLKSNDESEKRYVLVYSER